MNFFELKWVSDSFCVSRIYINNPELILIRNILINLIGYLLINIIKSTMLNQKKVNGKILFIYLPELISLYIYCSFF